MSNAEPSDIPDKLDLYAPVARVKGEAPSDMPRSSLEGMDPFERAVFEGNRRIHERLVARIADGCSRTPK